MRLPPIVIGALAGGQSKASSQVPRVVPRYGCFLALAAHHRRRARLAEDLRRIERHRNGAHRSIAMKRYTAESTFDPTVSKP